MSLARSPLASLLVSALLAVSVLSCQAKKAGVEAADIGFASLVYLEGSLTMDGVPLKVGEKVVDGALLKTGPESLAELVFAGKNALRIGENASLRVRLASLERSLSVDAGAVTAVLRKLDKLAGGRMTVNTPSLVAGVRGTSFYFMVADSGAQTYFCTCNGSVVLTPEGESEGILKEANHHDALIFARTPEAVQVSQPPAGFDHGHGDRDLETLAARIGETMDWSRIEK